MMSAYFFSVSAQSVTFYHPQDTVLSVLKGGYQQAGDGLFSAGQADALAVETLIYRTEEILESQGKILPGNLHAISSDMLLHRVCQRWLAGSDDITPQAIESAFNQLTDRLSYGPFPLTEPEIAEFCYFVFLREMAHHLGIVRIRYQP
ncbi:MULTISPECIES: hypothetical protein [Tatumella]|uniref:Uncharacterized protein n=1 Tax=Tatumella punctata TaxID=399969 RepID=A0ABW1VQI1_9GAMM|nr:MULTISPECIES: hypothetical protein [unclassified Tatumella]MBS0857426.1 hypothetical protein [Tatumella sp. JGM16]MBS0877807.1 hypothetical protein [Tatumella sp. JGM82]MBS0891512.1 hypothetical protein [Tatumella sp. JGM94]MBS0894401.1 hypothetical protein [Tatumella sp. JGM130]MBS0902442.1 hypothetical protein [Tatumella sp. JGM100]